MIRRYIISGKVQGVFFRKYTSAKANELELKGFVKNLSSGEVETIAQGDQNQHDLFLDFLKEGSPLSQVKNVEITDLEEGLEFTDFHIRYT